MTFYDVAKNIVIFLLKFHYRINIEFESPFFSDHRRYIVACNHVSDMDPVLLGAVFPRKIHYMAKQELFQIPILGFVISRLGAFPVARGKGDKGAIDNAVSIVKNGGVLGIFPEGKRSKDGKLQRLKSGTVVVASQTGGDIIPAAIIYGKRRLFHRRCVTVKFGKPILNLELNVSGRNKKELRAANTVLAGRIAGLLEVEVP